MLEELKIMIDESNYPYFEDGYLMERILEVSEKYSINDLVRDLCLEKAGIQEIRIGDIIMPSPRDHFLRLASKNRKSHTGTVKRADE